MQYLCMYLNQLQYYFFNAFLATYSHFTLIDIFVFFFYESKTYDACAAYLIHLTYAQKYLSLGASAKHAANSVNTSM